MSDIHTADEFFCPGNGGRIADREPETPAPDVATDLALVLNGVLESHEVMGDLIADSANGDKRKVFPQGHLSGCSSFHLHSQGIEQDPELERYSRQMLFEPIGPEGQGKLLGSRVVLIGCGGLGSVVANTLVRAGVGFMRIIDRDYLELNNLQRQVLFDEDDVAANLPKAEAARRKLQRINSSITVEAAVTDVNHRNIEQLGEDADLG